MNYQWIHQQFSNVNMKDARLQKRAVQIAQDCAEHPDKYYPIALVIGRGSKRRIGFLVTPKPHIRLFNNLIIER